MFSRRTASLTLCVVAFGTVSACGQANNVAGQRQTSGGGRTSTDQSQPPDADGVENDRVARMTDQSQPPDADGVENDRVARMTDQVTRVAGKDWASVLGGQHWDAQARQLVIDIVNDSEADALQANIEMAVGAVQGDYTHRFVRVERSYEELRSLAISVMSDRKQWAGDYAEEVVLVAPDRAINGLRVVATGHVAELRDLLKTRVGGVPVAAEQGVRGTAK